MIYRREIYSALSLMTFGLVFWYFSSLWTLDHKIKDLSVRLNRSKEELEVYKRLNNELSHVYTDKSLLSYESANKDTLYHVHTERNGNIAKKILSKQEEVLKNPDLTNQQKVELQAEDTTLSHNYAVTELYEFNNTIKLKSINLNSTNKEFVFNKLTISLKNTFPCLDFKDPVFNTNWEINIYSKEGSYSDLTGVGPNAQNGNLMAVIKCKDATIAKTKWLNSNTLLAEEIIDHLRKKLFICSTVQEK